MMLLFKILISSSKFRSKSDDYNQGILDDVEGRNTPEAGCTFLEFNPIVPSVAT